MKAEKGPMNVGPSGVLGWKAGDVWRTSEMWKGQANQNFDKKVLYSCKKYSGAQNVERNQ